MSDSKLLKEMMKKINNLSLTVSAMQREITSMRGGHHNNHGYTWEECKRDFNLNMEDLIIKHCYVDGEPFITKHYDVEFISGAIYNSVAKENLMVCNFHDEFIADLISTLESM